MGDIERIHVKVAKTGLAITNGRSSEHRKLVAFWADTCCHWLPCFYPGHNCFSALQITLFMIYSFSVKRVTFSGKTSVLIFYVNTL